MQAVVCEKPFALAVTERTAPHRNAREVLVRIRRVGLCGTDYHIYSGKHPYLSYPRVFGHELSGEILEVDADSPFRAGQQVTINPYLACGACVACRHGKPNCCVSLRVLGVHMDGGMCEVMSLPQGAIIDASGLSLDQAAMVEFLAIGTHAVRRAKVSPDDRVLVVGAGPIGIGVALFARTQGARVTLVDTLPERLHFARTSLEFGSVVRAGDDAADALAQITGGEMFECVLDATGNLPSMCAGLRYVCHGGKYVLVGVVQGDISFPDPEFHKRETTLLGSRNALNEDFAHVIEQISNGSIPTSLLHTHSMDASETPRRIPELIGAIGSVMKAIVTL
jgi:2-desacetyl-2-hydroxyethyl bacteriochlorophyllide A dehydrogenase